VHRKPAKLQIIEIKCTNKKCHAVGAIPNFNRKFVERGNIDILTHKYRNAHGHIKLVDNLHCHLILKRLSQARSCMLRISVEVPVPNHVMHVRGIG
jgi:hypothetical protein